MDEHIPLTCVDSVVTTSPETPGVRYWFRELCTRAEHLKGVDFFGKPLGGDYPPFAQKLIYDPETRDLWLVTNAK